MKIRFNYPNGNFNVNDVLAIPRKGDFVKNKDSGKVFVVESVTYSFPFSQTSQIHEIVVELEYAEEGWWLLDI